MGRGFKHSAGGGAPLNYKLVGGTTEPSNPKEVLLWISTDAKITGHALSASQPEAPAEGMVWVKTGKTSPVSFNALKKNDLQVYPLDAYQYIGGSWVKKGAKSYIGGKWNDWVTYLYNAGDTCDSVHGGWTTSTRWYQTNSRTPGITYNAESMTLKVTGGGTNFSSGIMETVNGVDLTDFATLTFVVKSIVADRAIDNNWAAVRLGTTANLTGSVTANTELPISEPGTYSLDISALSGVHDIIVKMICAGSGGTYTQVEFSSIYLS